MTNVEKLEFKWTDEPVIGLCLLNAERDSFGELIVPYVFYEVGKHKLTGKLAILPTEKNMKTQFENAILKRQGKFN